MTSLLVRAALVCAVLGSVLTAMGSATADAEVDGRDIYVSVDGDDDADGSRQNPLRTIPAAMWMVEPGDTVWVGGGTYDEQADQYNAISLRKSGRPDAWITLRAMPGERPLVLTTGWHGLQAYGHSYWHIEGFEFDGRQGTVNSGGGMVINNESHHIRFVDNWIHHFRGGGIGVSHSDYVHLENNRIWANATVAPQQTSGISLYQLAAHDDAPGFHNVITGNYVYDNENLVPTSQGFVTDGNCVIIDDLRNTQGSSRYPVYEQATLVTNNICFDNGGRGVHVYLSDHVHAANNTLFRNTRSNDIGHGELSASRSSDVTFVNNLVVSRNGAEPVFLWRSNDVTFNNNVYLETNRDTPDRSERHLSLDDAGLVNPTLDHGRIDLQPRAGSPLTGIGAPEPQVTVDYRNTARPSPPTPGALEPVSTPQPPPTTTTTRPTTTTTTTTTTRPTTTTTTRPTTTAQPTTTTIEPTTTTTEPTTTATTEPTTTTQPPAPTEVVAGLVRTTSGLTPIATANLFAVNGDGSRAAFLGSARTDAAGRYEMPAAPGCYVVVLIAPTGTTFDSGSRYLEKGLCVEASVVGAGPNGVIDDGPPRPAGPSSIGDRATYETGEPVPGLKVDLFAAGGDGSRSRFLGFTRTDDEGSYRFEVEAGCYVLVFIAPDGATFTAGGGRYHQRSACIGADRDETGIDAEVAGSPA